jgi:hypothetical protein
MSDESRRLDFTHSEAKVQLQTHFLRLNHRPRCIIKSELIPPRLARIFPERLKQARQFGEQFGSQSKLYGRATDFLAEIHKPDSSDLRLICAGGSREPSKDPRCHW